MAGQPNPPRDGKKGDRWYEIRPSPFTGGNENEIALDKWIEGRLDLALCFVIPQFSEFLLEKPVLYLRFHSFCIGRHQKPL